MRWGLTSLAGVLAICTLGYVSRYKRRIATPPSVPAPTAGVAAGPLAGGVAKLPALPTLPAAVAGGAGPAVASGIRALGQGSDSDSGSDSGSSSDEGKGWTVAPFRRRSVCFYVNAPPPPAYVLLVFDCTWYSEAPPVLAPVPVTMAHPVPRSICVPMSALAG
jgi:hypothetical protein